MSAVTILSDATFEKEVLRAAGPVVVDFWAPWCGPCRMMAPVLDAAAEKLAGRIKFAKLDTDENPQASRKYQIMAIPSLLVFDKGAEVDRLVGFLPPPELEKWLGRFVPTPIPAPPDQG